MTARKTERIAPKTTRQTRSTKGTESKRATSTVKSTRSLKATKSTKSAISPAPAENIPAPAAAVEPEADRREGEERRMPPARSVTEIMRRAQINRRGDSARARMNAPVSVVVESASGERIAIGTATLKNLSLMGALIADMKLSGGVKLDSGKQYVLRFRLMAGPLAGMEASCEAVRYDSVTQGFGVRLPDGFKLPII